MIVIVDYGLGNLGSIYNILKRLGAEAVISSKPAEIKKANKLILPGVGSYDYGMEQMEKFRLIDTLNEQVLTKKVPVLGICLGSQLFAKGSEEGNKSGLGWIDMEVVKFNNDKMSAFGGLKIPHMGWNEIHLVKESPLFRDMYENPRFYFVHSYHFAAANPDDVLSTASYGYEFVCAIEKNNIAGVQFHPEKSHKFGMKLLQNFAKSIL